MKNVLEFLEQASQKYFTKIAFTDENNEISYGQCVENAQKVGTALLSLQSHRQPIAVMMDKNVENHYEGLKKVTGDVIPKRQNREYE